MKKNLLLLTVCWMAFGYYAYAQNSNIRTYRDTIEKDGRMIASKHWVNEVANISMPPNVIGEVSTMFAHAMSNKDLIFTEIKINLLLQKIKKTYAIHYDAEKDRWSRPIQIGSPETSNVYLIIAITYLIILYFLNNRLSLSLVNDGLHHFISRIAIISGMEIILWILAFIGIMMGSLFLDTEAFIADSSSDNPPISSMIMIFSLIVFIAYGTCKTSDTGENGKDGATRVFKNKGGGKKKSSEIIPTTKKRFEVKEPVVSTGTFI